MTTGTVPVWPCQIYCISVPVTQKNPPSGSTLEGHFQTCIQDSIMPAFMSFDYLFRRYISRRVEDGLKEPSETPLLYISWFHIFHMTLHGLCLSGLLFFGDHFQGVLSEIHAHDGLQSEL